MPDVHLVVAIAVVALFAIGWIWGIVGWASRRGVGRFFWVWLTVAQVTAGVQALLGIVLLILGYRPDTWLHLVYGFGPIVVLVIAHNVARDVRNMAPNPKTGKTMAPWVPFAWAAFICFGLAGRALMTGLGVA